MRDMLDPILEKMISMPGMERKTFIKTPPMANGKGVPGKTTSRALPAGLFDLSGNGVKAATQKTARLQRRHGPGGKMLYGMGIYDQDSRLFDEKALNDPRLANVLERAMPFDKPEGQIRVHLTAGGKVNSERNDNSVHPAWRRAIVHSIATGGNTPTADSFRELAPDMGAYVNEVSLTRKLFLLTTAGLDQKSGLEERVLGAELPKAL
jgi:hypothetical protein